jgi:MFS transporter, ACDE family, multidrug resistance protein
MLNRLSTTGRQAPAYDARVWVVFGVAMLAVLRTDSIAPALPEMSAALALTPQEVGLVVSLFVLPSVFVSPFLGVLADRLGRKRILLFSLVLFGLAGAACALARSVETLLVLRLLQGIGAAALSPFNIILVADLFEDEARAKMMGYNSTVRVVGSIIYPLAGGLLAAYEWWLPFALPLLALPFALFVGWSLKDMHRGTALGLRDYFGGMLVHLRSRPSVAVFLAGTVVILVMFGAYFTYLPFLTSERFGMLPASLGLLISSRSVVASLVAAQFVRISRHLGVELMIQAACGLYGVAFVLIPLAGSIAGLAAVTVILGLAEGLYWPANYLAISKLAPDENRAGFIAINDSVLKIGQFIGPLVMGLAYSLSSAAGTFYLAAGLLFATVAGLFFLFGGRVEEGFKNP